MDGCAFISTNGGWNLAIGALSPSGRFHSLHGEDGCEVVTGQVQQDRCWLRVGLHTIATRPSAWLEKVPLKLEHTYNHESFPVAYLAEANPLAWNAERRTTVQGVLTVSHHLLMLAACLSVLAWPFVLRRSAGKKRLALASAKGARLQLGLLGGLFLWATWALLEDVPPLYALISCVPLVAILCLPGAPKQGPAGRYLLGAILATTFTHALFFGDDRYHMVISPVPGPAERFQGERAPHRDQNQQQERSSDAPDHLTHARDVEILEGPGEHGKRDQRARDPQPRRPAPCLLHGRSGYVRFISRA
jgi:hypothetical protein